MIQVHVSRFPVSFFFFLHIGKIPTFNTHTMITSTTLSGQHMSNESWATENQSTFWLFSLPYIFAHTLHSKLHDSHIFGLSLGRTDSQHPFPLSMLFLSADSWWSLRVFLAIASVSRGLCHLTGTEIWYSFPICPLHYKDINSFFYTVCWQQRWLTLHKASKIRKWMIWFASRGILRYAVLMVLDE